jgi:RHS repeat-associated protein
MLTDGMGRAFTWDAENRLIAVETDTIRVAYAYDGLSRRVRRTEFTRATPLVTWAQTADRHYLYDGWNVIAEYEGGTGVPPVIPARTHLWGLDLSNTVQEAGGVGGLLSVKEGDTAKYYTFDGNGNVSEVLDSAGSVQAHYEYDLFGNTTIGTGTWVDSNVWRFSSKPVDATSRLYYYGYRFCNPLLGRWINRDPIEESGGGNLYMHTANDPANTIDILGLKIDIYGSETRKNNVRKQLELLKKIHPNLNMIIDHLERSKREHTIRGFSAMETREGTGPYNRGVGITKRESVTVYDPSSNLFVSNATIPPEAVLAHELQHAYDRDRGESDSLKATQIANFHNALELRAVHAENIVRRHFCIKQRERY